MYIIKKIKKCTINYRVHFTYTILYEYNFILITYLKG